MVGPYFVVFYLVSSFAIISLGKKVNWSLYLNCLLMSFEPVHEISNNVVCATSKASDQPAHTRSLIRAFASRLSIL